MDVWRIYSGSDGEMTRELYRTLEGAGAAGVVAVNLLRACKASERAKLYKGGVRGKGSYRSMAYQKKNWSLEQLCFALEGSAGDLGIGWGWKIDESAPTYQWVLYVDLPGGQASFHSPTRLSGPDYPGKWSGKFDSVNHVIGFAKKILDSIENESGAYYPTSNASSATRSGCAAPDSFNHVAFAEKTRNETGSETSERGTNA